MKGERNKLIKQLSSAWHISAAILIIISNKTFCHTIHSPELPMKSTGHSFSAERHWPRTIFCINSFSPSPPWPPQSSPQCVPPWEAPTPLGPALPQHFIFKHLNSSQEWRNPASLSRCSQLRTHVRSTAHWPAPTPWQPHWPQTRGAPAFLTLRGLECALLAPHPYKCPSSNALPESGFLTGALWALPTLHYAPRAHG